MHIIALSFPIVKVGIKNFLKNFFKVRLRLRLNFLLIKQPADFGLQAVFVTFCGFTYVCSTDAGSLGSCRTT